MSGRDTGEGGGTQGKGRDTREGGGTHQIYSQY